MENPTRDHQTSPRTKLPFLTLLVVLALASWAWAEGSPSTAAALTDPWRRTVHGWENMATWGHSTLPPAASGLHPSLLAIFQVLVSVGSLLAFWDPDSQS